MEAEPCWLHRCAMHAWRFGSRLRSTGPLLGAGLIAGYEIMGRRSQRHEAQCAKKVVKEDEKGPGFLGVFLDASSVGKVKQLRGEGTWIDEHPHAIVHLHPDPEAQSVFRPLCGSKAEVKVKGVAEDKATKQRILIVDVTIGGGPLKYEGYVPTVSYGSEQWGVQVSDLLGVDLARRLDKEGVLATHNHSWSGQLPAMVLDGVRYPATAASYEKVNNVVLKGTVCTSTEYDIQKRECVPGLVPEDADSIDMEEDDDEEDEEPVECPLCTFMLASPCRDVFVVFKSCLDNAEGTNEKEDLDRCQESAQAVNACIFKYKLFSKDDEEGEEGPEEGEKGT